MDLKKYIADSAKTYAMRLKTVVPIDDEAMTRIERVVMKYDPISISVPKKTILQKSPLDFDREVENAEVWIVDFVFNMPAEPMVIREDIRKALDAPERYVIVKTKNDPTEIETLRLNAIEEINAEAKKRKLTPEALLSNEPEYVEGNGNLEDGSHLFGNDYNNAFLYHLNKIRDARRDAKIKSENTLFNFLNMPKREDQEPVQDAVDFNKDIPGIKVKPTEKDLKILIPDTSVMGNKNDETRVISKVFRDENGNRVVISKTFGDQAK
jgi:hypothetical protein